MIAEGTHRLGEALKNSKLADAISAQALLEPGYKLLQECRKDFDLLANKDMGPAQHQPSKVAKN
jgi:hypothetical protein